MTERIAVETLTLKEVSDIFKHSLETALPLAKHPIDQQMKKLVNAGVNMHKWVQPFEIVKGAKLNFYCQKFAQVDSPVVSIGMTHRTTKGMILMVADTSNGGRSNWMVRDRHWDNSVLVYTAHYCERYAERIMKIDSPTFAVGVDGIMYADIGGVARVMETLADGVEEIAFQFQHGQAFGYRDRKSKVVYYRTVYSNDMLRGDKSEFRGEWKESVEQLNDWFKWE